MGRIRNSLWLSIAGHALAFVLLWALAWVRPGRHRIAIEVSLLSPVGITRSGAPTSAHRKRAKARHERNGLDLRPAFVRNGIFASPPRSNRSGDTQSPAQGAAQSIADAKDLIAGDLKAADAFDNLAQNIGAKLDYPDVLAEEGIQGTTYVDLYFDSRGFIDEGRSEVQGDRGSLRGEMVRAVRSGLLSWYDSSATRLRLDEFRNQHFRADFTLSYSMRSEERTDKLASGSYHFLRRRQVDICLYPGAIDLACTAAKIAGFIADHTSDKHKVHVAAVLDILSDFDAQGLRGIDGDIQAQDKIGG